MTTPAKLVQLIRKHGHEACVKPDGRLHVASTTYPQDGGYPYYEYHDLPATMPAVLAWLGY